MDKISVERRSANMRQIKSQNTRPEMVVRRLLHGAGFRYALHRRDLPGVPDLVFPSRRKIIFVQGCFWHRHDDCIDGRIPKSRMKYWKSKLLRNAERDRRNIRALRRDGWSVATVWECEIDKTNRLRERLFRFLR